MSYLFYTTIFLFGLIVGSFLNAVIHRLHSGESILKGNKRGEAARSKCTKCGKVLGWRELVPVLSFFIQRRRCKGCNELISWQYPIVELAMGALFLGVFLMSNVQTQMPNQILIPNASSVFHILFLWTIVAGVVVIFVYDLKHYLIPDKILFPLIGLTFFYKVFEVITDYGLRITDYGSLLYSLISAFVAALFFFSLFYFSGGRAMGFGDVKLAFFMGLLLGFPGILTALFIAFTTGAIIGIGLIVAKKKSMQSKVPFAPFLIFGTFISLFWSENIINWYLNLFI